jgi:glycosyltransferase involved in cell wall biosynthesis
MWSGAGKAIVSLAGGLQSLGHELQVVSSGESKGFTDWTSYVNDLDVWGIPYHSMDFFDRNPEVFWSSVERLRCVVSQFKPDIIHAHSGMAAFGAIAASNTPVVTTLHSWNPARPDWMNAMDLWALNQCRRVVCVSPSYRDYLLELGLRKDISQSIFFGVDTNDTHIMAAAESENPMYGKKYFCYLGRLESRKRQLLLVDTLGLLDEDWNLLLIGPEGEPGYAELIFERARQLGVLNRLVWTGPLDNPFPLVRQSRCFVSASSDEGLGLSVLEAMVLQVPVVATAARGVVDLVRDGVTGLIAAATPSALATQISNLASDTPFAAHLASVAAAMVQSTFQWPGIVGRYVSLFEDVIQEAAVLDGHNHTFPSREGVLVL